MVLTATKITTITPRGGAVGTTVSVVGTNFGIATGTVLFDPLGEDGGPYSATIISWTNGLISFTVPAGVPANKFTVLQILRADSTDFDTEVWWTPASFPPQLTDGMDFQYPQFEEGADLNALSLDDPRLVQAADFNRILERVNFAIATSTGDMLKSVYDPNDDGIVNAAVALDGTAGPGAGTLKTWADIVALVAASSGAPTVVRTYTPGVAVKDVVYQRSNGEVDRASAASLATAPAMGVVETLDSPIVGQCIVRFAGDLSGFTGLTVGAVYILSRDSGKILREDATADPDYPDLSGNIIQEVGIGGPSGTTLFVGTNRDFVQL